METNKLKAKDLINVGIYTAIYIVIFFVVGMLNAIPVLYPLLYVLIPLISGIPFMLFLTKIEKFGMVTIMSVICGVFWFLMGYPKYFSASVITAAKVSSSIAEGGISYPSGRFVMYLGIYSLSPNSSGLLPSTDIYSAYLDSVSSSMI